MRDAPSNGSEAWVLGLGQSGKAAALLLRGHGIARVRVFDSRDNEALRESARELAQSGGIEVTLGAKSLPSRNPSAPSKIVISPGIAPPDPLYASDGTISELQLGLQAMPSATVVAVTGSKGKSSLVKLIADALAANGASSAPCGNYGLPTSELALRRPQPQYAIAECSSFQLEATRRLAPRVAVFLNLSPDHLDRHGSMEEYCRMKMRVFEGQPRGALALAPSDGALPGSLAFADFVAPGARLVTFGNAEGSDYRYDQATHCVIAPVTRARIARPPISIAGSYFDNGALGAAAAAAAAALEFAGLPDHRISAAIRGFEPLPHRMQTVGEVDGVKFVDNSKATSLEALFASLGMIPGPKLLIAGGRPKEIISPPRKNFMAFGVKKVYLIGECSAAMDSAWSPFVKTEECGTLENAVRRAREDAVKGDAVLLSPGAASFDQFKNFQERGECFAAAVANLANKTANTVEKNNEN